MSVDLAAAAVRLASRGVAVFPLAPGAKVPPAGSHGHLEASADVDRCRARWADAPLSNIGIACGPRSGFWALDVDPRHGSDQALADLEAEHGALPPTVKVMTPSGGVHLYWSWPPNGPEIRNSAGRVGPGLDVRGEGGYIIAPPSVLADGRRYRWAANGPRAIAPAPPWLVKLTLPPPPPPRPDPKPLSGDVASYVATAAASELATLEAAKDGTRNNSLNTAAFNLAQFVKAGALPEDWCRSQLEARAIDIGLSATEARRTIASAFAAAQPRTLPT